MSMDYETSGGITVRRSRSSVDYSDAVGSYIDRLDFCRGAVFSSNYEYPGRYTRWDTAIIAPPLGITSRGRSLTLSAYNSRGVVLLKMLTPILESHAHVSSSEISESSASFDIIDSSDFVYEELRSRRPSIFSLLRVIVEFFGSSSDDNLGLFGAFGYDLAFQFDEVDYVLPRPADQRDLVLYLPDEILVVDHHSATAWHERYDFLDEKNDLTTEGLPRDYESVPFVSSDTDPGRGDHEPGEYARLVKKAKKKFECGDLFEVVPGQLFTRRCAHPPSVISRRLKDVHPSPYSFFINLGEGEYLVGASPEMFVRVEGRRVETCPISGTIRRGRDPIEDSEQILRLLNSKKDEAELTMCSDVDRNDKSRVCEPGSVKVIGRRQIEMYSRLIHTVDHIEGRLREGMDAFDAFLSHAWAVTVTGAPKLWAMRFIEEHEKSPRAWYGGAIGMVGFNGNMNTGLTLRTIRIKDGIAEVRAGATLLYDSDPADEEAETELKASAFLDAIGSDASSLSSDSSSLSGIGEGSKILLVDHEDSFVHTLANYFRQTGADVVTLRYPLKASALDEISPDLVVMSPGPGCPSDFDCSSTIDMILKKELPLFGVCLGQQAIGEFFGGSLYQLSVPVHGKPSRLRVTPDNSRLFSGLDNEITVGRYHSLCLDRSSLPDVFRVTAETDDGVVMAIEHESLPICAVQFHPESIMSLGGDDGMSIIRNVVSSFLER